MNINSLTDLYERLLPALDTKCQEFRRNNYKITQINLWNHLITKVWKDKKDLQLYEMVNDIMAVKISDLCINIESKGDDNENR